MLLSIAKGHRIAGLALQASAKEKPGAMAGPDRFKLESLRARSIHIVPTALGFRLWESRRTLAAYSGAGIGLGDRPLPLVSIRWQSALGAIVPYALPVSLFSSAIASITIAIA